MKKWKMKSLAKGLATLAVTAVVGLGAAIPAFAANGSGTEKAPVQAAITKELDMAAGVTIPAAEFVFTATPVSLNGQTTAAATMPALNATNLAIDFTGSTATKLQSNDILAGVIWTAAGEYVYTIKEDAAASYQAATGETVTYSQAEYTLYVYVDYDAATSTYFAKEVATKVEKDDDGNNVPGGTKVNPLPGDGTTTFSELAFVNKYAKQGGQTGGTTPEDTFLLSKTVTDTTDTTELARYFTFEIEPSSVAGGTATTYKAFVVDSTGAVVTNTTHAGTLTIANDAVKGDYIELPVDDVSTIYLKHGEKLVIDDIYYGATVEVNEKGILNYTPTVRVVSGGEPSTTNIPGTANTDLETGEIIVSDHARNKSRADYINAFADTTETGLRMSTMPFILLLAAAVAGLGLYTVNRSRKHS